MDLKLHVKANHKTVFREAPVDSFGEPNSFWFSKFPKDYIRIIKPTRRDSQEARFSRRAVERWWPSVGSRASKSLADWREGWSCAPLITPSPSPVLDFEDKPTPSRHAIHQLIVGSDQVMAIIYMEFKSSVIWYKVTIDSRVLTAPKELTSKLRRMSTIEFFNGVIPKRFGRALEGERLKFARNSLHKTLGIEASYLSVIYKTESISFSEDTEEIEGPSKKKFKAIHQSPESLFKKPTSEGKKVDQSSSRDADKTPTSRRRLPDVNHTVTSTDLRQVKVVLHPLDLLLPLPDGSVAPAGKVNPSEEMEPEATSSGVGPDSDSTSLGLQSSGNACTTVLPLTSSTHVSEIPSEVESDAGLSSPRLNPNSASMKHTDSESIMDDTPTTSEGKQSKCDAETALNLHHPKPDVPITEEDPLQSMGGDSISPEDQQPSDASLVEESQLQSNGDASFSHEDQQPSNASLIEESQLQTMDDASSPGDQQPLDEPWIEKKTC